MSIVRSLPAILLTAAVILEIPNARADAHEVLTLGSETYVVELALTNEERWQGLSERETLEPGHAMVFVWPEARPRRFHMRGMLFPIDIIFLGPQGEVLNVANSVEPCPAEPCPRYYSAGPSPVVIEVPAGEASQAGVAAGMRVDFPASWRTLAE